MRPSNTITGAARPGLLSVAEKAWKRCVTWSCAPGAHHKPCTGAGTTHRCTVDFFSRPMRLSGASSTTLRSGAQSPMSQSWLTTRVPAGSISRRGRSCRFSSGSRYIVTTLKPRRSVANRSCSRNSARSATPALRALARLCATRSGTISTPSPRAPKRRAAVMTMRPSPEPRSTSRSPACTSASCSRASVTLSGVVMNGTSSWAAAQHTPTASAAAMSPRRIRPSAARGP